MNRSDVVLLFDHLYWLRDRVLAAADDPSIDLQHLYSHGLQQLSARPRS